jgi:hypothetical protein
MTRDRLLLIHGEDLCSLACRFRLGYATTLAHQCDLLLHRFHVVVELSSAGLALRAHQRRVTGM